MKSIRIIKEHIKNYNKLANDFINPINKIIKDYIHGNKELDTKKHIQYIKDVLNNYKHENFHIDNFKFYENYSSFGNWVKDEITEESTYNDRMFAIEIYFSGKCDCRAIIKISKGTTNIGSTEIYYFNPYENTIDIEQVDSLEQKLYQLLRQEYISQIIDLSFKNNIYLEYSDLHKNYIIWNKKPREYGNCIEGGHSDELKEHMINNLKQLNKCDDVKKYAESKMYGEEGEIKWINYYL